MPTAPLLREYQQEQVTAQNINNADVALTDTLDFAPVSTSNVLLFLNGVLLRQGVALDYTLGGTGNQTITWLANTGTAPNLSVNDALDAYYVRQ